MECIYVTVLFVLFNNINALRSSKNNTVRSSLDSGILIVDQHAGKIYREGTNELVGELPKDFMKRDSLTSHSTNFIPTHAPFYSNRQSSDNCVTFHSSQQLCGPYSLPWANNGTARICGSLPEPPAMPGVYAMTQATVFTLLSIMGLLGNGLIVFAVSVSGCLQTPVYWLLAGLASSSIVLLITQDLLLLPQTVLVEDSWVLGELSCYLFNVMSAVATVASTLFILIIAFERYFFLKCPGKAREVFTARRARGLIVCNWIISFVYGSCWVAFVEFDSCLLNNGEGIDRCKIVSLDIWRAVLSVTEGFFLLALPLAAAVILLVQTTAPQLPPTRQIYNPAAGAMPAIPRTQSLARTPLIRRADKPYDLVRLMLCILIAYILLAAPRRLMELYINSTTEEYNTHLVNTILYSLMFLDCAVFPFLVIGMSSNMRRGVIELLRRKRRLYTKEVSTQKCANKARQMQRRSRFNPSGAPIPETNSISFIHVSPSGHNLNRLSSSASFSRSMSTNSGSSSNRHSSSESVTSYDDVFCSFPAPRGYMSSTSYA